MRYSKGLAPPPSETQHTGDEESLFGMSPFLYLKALVRAWPLRLSAVIPALMLVLLIHFVMGNKYTAAATISQAIGRSSMTSGALGFLSAATGGGINDTSGADFEKYRALLQSTRLAHEMQARQGVMQIVFAREWDATDKRWRAPWPFIRALRNAIGLPWKPPDDVDLAKWLRKNVSLETFANGASGLDALRSQIYSVTLTFRHQNQIVPLLGYVLKDADDIVRQDQMRNSSNRVDYLERTIKWTTDVALLDSLRKILLD